MSASTYVTINILSLFAFILVLGVVDDAIIVGESAHSERRDQATVESIIAHER